MPRAELVWAGHEPAAFTHLFPTWTHSEEVEESNRQVQPHTLAWCLVVTPSQAVGSPDLEAAHASLARTEYSWAELQARPLPPGVDPARIETYLGQGDFQVWPTITVRLSGPF